MRGFVPRSYSFLVYVYNYYVTEMDISHRFTFNSKGGDIMSENTNEKEIVGSIAKPNENVLNEIFNRFTFNPDWIKPVECAKVVPQRIHLA